LLSLCCCYSKTKATPYIPAKRKENRINTEVRRTDASGGHNFQTRRDDANETSGAGDDDDDDKTFSKGRFCINVDPYLHPRQASRELPMLGGR
jgi:hypothetical protein